MWPGVARTLRKGFKGASRKEGIDRHALAPIGALKRLRNQTEHHISVKSLPEHEQSTRLSTERKHVLDTIKMVACRAESSMASLPRLKLARSGDAPALPRQNFETEADLRPELSANTLTVRLHHLILAAHDREITNATPPTPFSQVSA